MRTVGIIEKQKPAPKGKAAGKREPAKKPEGGEAAEEAEEA